MRASLARTEPVRRLRPQGLPIKLIAVGATTAAINVPLGAVREHFDKFSFGWFVAVHASIPFVAMLRKAVLMPKLAIVLTIAAAVVGQVLGSRVERKRIARVKRSVAAGPVVAVRRQAPGPTASEQKQELFAALLSLTSLVPQPSVNPPAFLAHIPARLRVS
jgi:O-antigen ligase